MPNLALFARFAKLLTTGPRQAMTFIGWSFTANRAPWAPGPDDPPREWFQIRSGLEIWLSKHFNIGLADISEHPLQKGDPEAVSVLIELLEVDDAKCRQFAACGLGQVGPAARSAVPSLLKALQREQIRLADSNTCKDISHALERIDPEAAKQVGSKP